jgi:hypothetical protein
VKRDSDSHVELSDDAKYAMKEEGTIMFKLDFGGFLYAHDVLYIPGLKKNFPSVLEMEEKGFSITF